MGCPRCTAIAPDLQAIKSRQQKTWASGDYSAVAATIPLISEQLCDAADLRAGWRVLDVAGGSGNTALAAARCGCDVVSIDYVPSLLERARVRSIAEGLPIETIEGDAEALPVADASFDAVVSALGVMFAPDHERAAAEMLRACRPGGTIALANWTPDGFIGGLFATVGAHVPPPAGLTPPPRWGTEEHVRAPHGRRCAHAADDAPELHLPVALAVAFRGLLPREATDRRSPRSAPSTGTGRRRSPRTWWSSSASSTA